MERTYDSNYIWNKIFSGTSLNTRQDTNNILNTVYDSDANTIKVNLDSPSTNFIRGFERLNPDTMGDPSYDETTRTFSYKVKAGQTQYHFWALGNKYIKTTTQTVVYPDVSNIYYFYFDTAGVLQYIANEDLTEAIFKSGAICGLCGYNATTGLNFLEASDEEHGVIMDASTHFHDHLAFGMVYYHGGDITGLADGISTYTNIGTMINGDEDITLVALLATSHIFMWKEGGVNDWVNSATADNNIGYNGGSGDIYWNEETSPGVFELTRSAASTDFMIYSVLVTNDKDHPIRKVLPTTAYASRLAARNALKDQLYSLTSSGLPSTETFFAYAYIVKRDGTLEDDGAGEVYVDLRSTKGYKEV